MIFRFIVIIIIITTTLLLLSFVWCIFWTIFKVNFYFCKHLKLRNQKLKKKSKKKAPQKKCQ